MSSDPTPASAPPVALKTELRGTFVALVVGAVGGAALAVAGMPAGWLLGSMALTAVAALVGAKPRLPMPLRDFMVAVLAVLVGGRVSPELIDGLDQWVVSMAAVVSYIGVALIVAATYLQRIAKFDLRSAYFAALPGGISEIAVMSSSFGGNTRRIVLVHSLRAPTVILLATLATLSSVETTAPQATTGSFHALDLAAILLCALVGWTIGRRFRLYAGIFVVSFLISAGAHLTGLITAPNPAWLTAGAQVVVGAWIGAGFAGFTIHELVRTAFAGIGSTALMIGITLAASLFIAQITTLSLSALLLALAPGGMSQLVIVAIIFGVDPAFVAAHQAMRIILVILAAPTFFRLWMKWKGVD